MLSGLAESTPKLQLVRRVIHTVTIVLDDYWMHAQRHRDITDPLNPSRMKRMMKKKKNGAAGSRG